MEIDGWLAQHLPLLDEDEGAERKGRRPRVSPGKRSLTAMLRPRQAATHDAEDIGFLTEQVAPVQREASDDARRRRGAADDPFAIHLTAREGVRGGGGTLPHQAAIQASFGHHDVSGVKAHVGGAAADAAEAIGARAYATGGDIAFAASPDLRQAAHEAAHVVQQRGGVMLDGGVGQRGDAYEQHADAVADLVVRGESAQALLDAMAPAPLRGDAGAMAAHAGAVQRLDLDGDGIDDDRRPQQYEMTAPETREATGRPEDLRGAPLDDLFALFALRDARTIGPRITGFHRMTNGVTFSYEWASGTAGSATIRGEIRAQLTPGVTAEQRTAYLATIDGLSGSTPRRAELRTIIQDAAARTAAGDTETAPAMMDRGDQGRTYTRRGRSRVDGADMSDRIHAATDVDAPIGTGVYAPVAGTVVQSNQVRGYGHIVTIVHERMPPPYARRRFQTAYAHLSERLVEAGETVSAGHAIGLVGNTRTNSDGDGGRVAGGMGAHLHFGVIELFGGAEATGWSSGREESYGARPNHIEPDDWLAALHVRLSDAPYRRGTDGADGGDDHDPDHVRCCGAGAGGGGGRRGGARREAAGMARLDGTAAVDAAQVGLRGAHAPLPHLDRIQASFGRHDVGGVTTARDAGAAEAAEAIGARAYASGEQIAFAGEPSLHTAAHEAAHVIQQRHGDAPDGVGAAGDRHEQHADAIAERVVRGESAEPLLDELAEGLPRAAVQRIDLDGDGIDDDRRPQDFSMTAPEITRGDDDAGRLEGLPVRDIFPVYAMGGHATGDGSVTGFTRASNGATFSYAWVNSPAGTAALRSVIRRGLRAMSADERAAARTSLDALRGPAARIDELRTMIDEANAAPPAAEGAEGAAEGTEGAAADPAAPPLPPGITAEQLEAAVAHNSGLGMRIDWVRRLQQHLRADGHMVSEDGTFDAETVAGVAWLQHDGGLPVTGIVDAATRPLIEAGFADLHSSLLGEHLEERVLVPASATGEQRYGYYRDIITRAGGVFLDGANQINLLGIRGAIVEEIGGQLQISQSASAAEFASARDAAGDPLPGHEGIAAEGAATTSLHFSGRTAREDGFDDAIISISFVVDESDTPTYRVRERRGSVDPQSFWSGPTGSDGAEGTSHLRDGQYRYRLGEHTTHAPAHRAAVGTFDHPEEMDVNDDGHDSHGNPTTRYDALVARDNIEVWRDSPDDDDHFLTGEEERESDREIAERDAPNSGRGDRYTGRNIAINIHTAPNSGPSSQGCQNVPVGSGYEEMIGEVRDSENPDNVYYTLIDASRIDSVISSAPLQQDSDPGAAARLRDPAAMHAAARHGVSGGGQRLPHLASIQASFGHHDVGGVQAHVGGAAAAASAAIGARAYATGDDVAFAAAPDLRQAAHEAAHVVQQRGGVRLDGGIGRTGDPYEQHADAVADRVVRGESAEALLDTMAHRGPAGGPAVQRLDSHDIVGDVMSATGDRRTGDLDARSQRRVYERLAELDDPPRDAAAAGREFEAMDEAARAQALDAGLRRFQGSAEGAELIDRIGRETHTADPSRSGEELYETRPLAERVADFGAEHPGSVAPQATYTPGAARPNDITMQALACAWPQHFFGRLLDQDQAWELLRRLVLGRGLPFNAQGVNVVGLRGFQGEMHDNGEGEPAAEGTDPATRRGRRMFTGQNRFDDVMYIVSMRDGERRVDTSRATVDPGGESPNEFQVAADQQWDYRGNPDGRTQKYDRPLYGLDDPSDVRRGRYWQQHPEEAAAASRGSGGRLIRREHDQLELDRDAAGDPRLVSAVHSGGRGGPTGEETGGDSIGCSVVHGAWYAHFNESLRAADAARTDGHAGESGVQFTYSLIDPRTYTRRELQQILDSVAPAPAEEPAAPPAAEPAGGEPIRQTPYEMVPRETPYEAPVRAYGGFGRTGDPFEQHADEVADLVVRGESAEAALDRMVPGAAPAVQRLDFDGDGRDDGAVRAEARITQLIQDIVDAIAQNEVGGGPPTESAMATSAGVPASYAAVTQMTSSHAVQVLIGARGDTAGTRAERRAYAAEYGLDADELYDARRVMAASNNIWDAIVRDGVAPEAVDADDLRVTRFTPDELARMVRFRELRAQVIASRDRFTEIQAATRTWLTARATEALAQVDSLRPGEPAPETAAAEPAAESAPSVPERALDGMGGGRRGRIAALRRPWRVPRRLTQAHLDRRRDAITAAQGHIEEAAGWAGETLVAEELFADDDFAALAAEVGIDRSAVRVYINSGDFNKFAEDRNGWARLAIQRSTEANPEPGAEARTYDSVLSDVASDHGGRGLAMLEYRLWLRRYIDDHPTHTDRQVVRAAAEHNSADDDYPDTIWRNYQAIVAARPAPAADAPADAPAAAAATTTTP